MYPHKKFLFALLLTLSSAGLNAQIISSPAILKKHKVKIVSTSWDGGTTYHLIDANGYKIKSAYDDPTFKRVESSSEVFYNSNNQPDSILHNGGSSAEYFYYSANGVLQIYRDAGTSDSTWIDKSGKKIRAKSSDGGYTKYEYNSQKQLIKKIKVDSSGTKSVTTYTYNALGQLVSEKYTEGEDTVTYLITYDKKGLPATRTSKYSSGSKFTTNYGYEYY